MGSKNITFFLNNQLDAEIQIKHAKKICIQDLGVELYDENFEVCLKLFFQTEQEAEDFANYLMLCTVKQPYQANCVLKNFSIIVPNAIGWAVSEEKTGGPRPRPMPEMMLRTVCCTNSRICN